MAGTNILCTDWWLGQNFYTKQGYSAGSDNSRMMKVSEIAAKYQVNISGSNSSSRLPIQTEINATPPGSAWTSVGTSYNWQSVAYGNGVFIAVESTYGYVFNSTDGTNWTLQSTGYSYGLCSIAYGNGMFVAVGTNKRIIYSSNYGASWSGMTITSDNTKGHITYGNGYFIIVYEGGNTICRSTNGTSWTTEGGDGQTGWTDVVWGGTGVSGWRYIAVAGITNNGRVMYNLGPPAGWGWTNIGWGTPFGTVCWTPIVNQYIIVGPWGGAWSSNFYPSATSGNGQTWTIGTAGTIHVDPKAIRYGNGICVLVGVGSSVSIQTTVNGTSWINVFGGYGTDFYGVAYGNNIWVAVGNGVTARADG